MRRTVPAQPINLPAAIYARFSSHKQDEESIEQQVAECKRFAETRGLNVIEVYADAAISGRSDRRPQFQRLKRDADKGKFAAIIAYKSSRIARNLMNALNFEYEMQQRSIAVYYAKEEYGDDATGKFMRNIMMATNQFHSDNMGEDIRRAQNYNALQCRANGPASYGYKTGEDGRFAVDEATAPIVREIFQRVADGEAYVEIAEDLNRRCIPTRSGGKWNKSSFQTILNNERYRGTYIFGDVRIDGGMPVIVPDHLYTEVQNVMNSTKIRHRRNADGVFALTGKLFCGECGERMIGMSGTSKSGTRHHYYVCAGKRTEKICRKKDHRRDQLECEIAAAIMHRICTDAFVEQITDMYMDYQRKFSVDSELQLLTDEHAENDRALRNILHAIEQGIITETTAERMRELESKQRELKGKIAVLKSDNTTATRDDVMAYMRHFRGLDVESAEVRQQLFDTFLVAAYVWDDHAKLVFDPMGTGHVDADITLADVSECSYNVYDGSPSQIKTNTQGVTMRGRLFVFSVSIQR